MKHFISIADLTKTEIISLLKHALVFKQEKSPQAVLKNKLLVSVYEKPSLRTRLSFEKAMYDLGGSSAYYNMQDIGIGVREEIKDVARVASSMCDVLCLRVYRHTDITEFAAHSQVPVINALSDYEHPCQALGDLLTIFERKAGGNAESLQSLKVSYIGDCRNNVTHSLALACALLGIHFTSAGPPGYEMDQEIFARAQMIAKKNNESVRHSTNPREAVAEADIVYTDTWVSMGCEQEKRKRLLNLQPYQVTKELMSYAKSDALFMHCMPAYRGNEVTEEVIDGQQSIMYQQAENRLHAQKALLAYLLA